MIWHDFQSKKYNCGRDWNQTNIFIPHIISPAPPTPNDKKPQNIMTVYLIPKVKGKCSLVFTSSLIDLIQFQYFLEPRIVSCDELQ